MSTTTATIERRGAELYCVLAVMGVREHLEGGEGVHAVSEPLGGHLVGMDSGQEGVRLGRSTTKQARPGISAFGWDEESRQITLIWHRDPDFFFVDCKDIRGLCVTTFAPLC